MNGEEKPPDYHLSTRKTGARWGLRLRRGALREDRQLRLRYHVRRVTVNDP